jgi:prolipoprotein diacylglyceryltransferase
LVGGGAVVWYAIKKNIGVIHLADATAVVLPIGYAIGRLGCQVAGDGCWGIDNPDPMPEWMAFLPEWLWSYTYPHNIINEGVLIPGCTWENCYELAVPVYPTPLYESLMMLTVFGILFSLRKRIRIPGMMFTLYFIFAGIERFLIEKIRINNVYKIFGYEVTQAELISSAMIIAGLIAVFFLIRNREKMINRFGNSASKEVKSDA